MKKIHSFILLLISMVVLNAQSNTFKDIDKLLEYSQQEYAKMELISSLKNAKKALILSINNKYDKGICKANLNISNVLLTIGMYKDGLFYLENAVLTSFYKSTPSMQAEVCRLRGRAYTSLKLYEISIKEYRKQLKISKNIEDKDLKDLSILFTHQNLSNTFQIQNNKDSVFKHLKIQEELLKKHFNEKDDYYYYSTLYNQYGDYYLSLKQYEIANEYFNKSIKLLQNNDAQFLYTTFIGLAKLEERRNIEKTIIYYKKALENAKKIGSKETEMYIYKDLSNYYITNNINSKEATIYLYKYQDLNDSLDVKNKELVQLAFDQLIDQRDQNHKENSKQIVVFFFIVVCISFVGMIFWYVRFLKTKKEILNIMETKTILRSNIKEVGVEIDKKQKKIEELELKANNYFFELSNLVEQNSPHFWGRFQEIYPSFSSKILEINSTLKVSELTFCSYIYLGFSNKDIAKYTYKSIRTVENNRYNLRKKLNLNTEEDFTIWLRKFVDKLQ